MEDCDYLVSILPGTSETKYMLSGDVLKSCNKKKPFFINIGRGNLIDSGTIQKAIRQIDKISEFLEECDYIISVLPGTPETKDMLSGEILKSCKHKKPYFINIGRGDLINTSTIDKAIREGWICGALLDVMEKEPLPPDHPLWSIPNVSITPHCSGVPNIIQMADLFVRNFNKFKENEPLLYAYDFNSGY
ncbi:hypothetical protein FSP39_002357 [Pinctada imbricata]|uniref:D-isomer specific 2-hydroxyacid dehydrogenase NAD-binding domain-containing protein n=1 Tax=Pinctada imbricata TaxID=66713 RepID=A0AA88Y4I5_PINIB|nr:hypothetical protein FSP39_002357 [Pinctada imbricata]